MQSDSIIFAGVELSSGRKPVTFAALDDNLNIKILENWTISESLVCLKENEDICLVINKSSYKGEQGNFADFKHQLGQMGFKSFSKKSNGKQWFETKARDCFRELIEQNPLPRRTLEGRLQRALVLYEQGLRIDDPMEIFEEITRYKLIQGIFRLENIYSSKELDALIAAYLAWMIVTHPERIVAKNEFVLPAQE